MTGDRQTTHRTQLADTFFTDTIKLADKTSHPKTGHRQTSHGQNIIHRHSPTSFIKLTKNQVCEFTFLYSFFFLHIKFDH